MAQRLPRARLGVHLATPAGGWGGGCRVGCTCRVKWRASVLRAYARISCTVLVWLSALSLICPPWLHCVNTGGCCWDFFPHHTMTPPPPALAAGRGGGAGVAAGGHLAAVKPRSLRGASTAAAPAAWSSASAAPAAWSSASADARWLHPPPPLPPSTPTGSDSGAWGCIAPVRPKPIYPCLLVRLSYPAHTPQHTLSSCLPPFRAPNYAVLFKQYLSTPQFLP